MKSRILVVSALLLLVFLLLQGCAEKAEEMPAEESTEIDDDFSDLESIDEDLSMDELENLDKELGEINW